MEFAELTKMAFSRVQKVEPENARKILGCILLREPDEDEMVQLAYGTDAALVAKIADANATLAAIYACCGYGRQHCPYPAAVPLPLPPCEVRPLSPALSFHVQPPHQYWPESLPAAEEDEFPPHVHGVALRGGLDSDAVGACYYTEDTFANGGGGGAGGLPVKATGRRSNGVASRRPCHYFIKGICKNGQNCHYSHNQLYFDGFAAHGEDHQHLHGGTTPGSLETLELEITQLLNSRRGQPVSIASLPTLYGEKYGKGLQADGYLTESQRHGKAGYSLTKLLSRLNKIRVIERPHGQHSVVLAQDAASYLDVRSDRGGDICSIPTSSHQIYLTFPAESTFTEDDVANYFGQYGLVRDVRIPCQERRMFGFVSFQNPETVSTILMRRNPHFICGSRVLVKPYREKSKCIERAYMDKIKPMIQYYPQRLFEVDPDFYSEYDDTRLIKKQLIEKQEKLMQVERMRLSEYRLDSQFAFFDCSIEDASPMNTFIKDSKELDIVAPLVSPDPLDIVSTSQLSPTSANKYDDQESNQIELLPESPFSSSVPTGNNISAII